MSVNKVVVKSGAPLRVAGIRDTIESYGHVGELFEELMARAEALALKPIGPWLAIYYDTGPMERDVDVEVAIPVDADETREDRLSVRDLPVHDQIISLMVHGPYAQLSAAYDEIMDWVRQSNFNIAGPNREIYLEGPEMHDDPANYVTEIQFPVIPRPAD